MQFRRRHLARASSCNRLGPLGNRAELRRGARVSRNIRRFRPPASLDGIPYGHDGRSIRDLEIFRRKTLYVAEVRQEICGILETPGLQEGVRQIVHGVKFFADVTLLMGRCAGSQVSLDRVWPKPEQ